jgi:hypothetical protein
MQVLPLTATEHVPMDFNYLYHRQQVSVFMSENAASDEARASHLGLARGYSAEIAAALRARRPSVAA